MSTTSARRRTSLGFALGALAVVAANAAGQSSSAVERADSAYQAGAYPLATSLYERIVAGETAVPSLALFRLATLRSWDGRLDEANALYRRYIVQRPDDAEGRLALARTLAWGGSYVAAIATYDSLISGRQRLRDATLGRAQTMAWAGDLKGSLAAYKGWLKDHPTDRETEMDYARTLAWDGRMDEAEALFGDLARTGNATAKKGLARVIGWKGDLQRSEETWRQVLATDPADPEALTGLAQVLSWQGRQSDAESALQQALRANPSYGDARTLMRWVQADLRPSVNVAATSTNDSDHNRATTLTADYLAPTRWGTSLGASYVGRRADFAAIDSRGDGVNLFGRWQPLNTAWQVRVDGGVTRHSSTLAPVTTRKKTIGSGGLHFAGNVGRALTIGFGGSRAPFDETALLIANGVVMSEYAGEARIALPQRFSLSASGGHAQLTGGSRDNARDAYSSTLRWTASRRWSLAVSGRRFGYDTTSSDGYFAPRRYLLIEAGARAHLGANLGWNADGDVGMGRQSIELFGAPVASRLAERGALSFGYRFDPSHEISAAGNYANVAAPGQSTGSEYKWYSFSLRARVGF